MSRILVTGANGFIGSAVCPALAAAGHTVRAAVRRRADSMADGGQMVGGHNFGGHNFYWHTVDGRQGKSADDGTRGEPGIELCEIGDIGPDTDWIPALEDVEIVIHLAGRAHLPTAAAHEIEAGVRVNVAGTGRLARQAASRGVRRLVFASSIKVHGDRSAESPFTEESPVRPGDPYGRSKWQAEKTLRQVEEDSGMAVVILRLPLVYGPGVKANFLRLLRWVEAGVPLPLGSIRNRRSMIGLGNLADFIRLCVKESSAAGETFLAADGVDLSTPELIRRIAGYFHRPARLVPVPPRMLVAGARLLGKSEIAQRLCGSLTVDIGKARRHLGWQPPVSIDEGLEQTVEWYIKAGHSRRRTFRPGG